MRMTENEELKKAALQLKAMVICTSIKTHRSCSECVNENDCGKDEYDTDIIFAKSANIIFDALEELESYRAIGTIEEFKALKENSVTIANGKWIDTQPEYSNGYYKNVHVCSNCSDYYTTEYDEMNFCPKCGAKMTES